MLASHKQMLKDMTTVLKNKLHRFKAALRSVVHEASDDERIDSAIQACVRDADDVLRFWRVMPHALSFTIIRSIVRCGRDLLDKVDAATAVSAFCFMLRSCTIFARQGCRMRARHWSTSCGIVMIRIGWSQVNC